MEEDRQRRSTPLASSFPGINTTGLLQWGYVMSTVYQSTVTGTNDLEKRITTTIHANMFLRTWQQLEYLLDFVRATKGVHSEVF
jgi:hypothetical protein